MNQNIMNRYTVNQNTRNQMELKCKIVSLMYELAKIDGLILNEPDSLRLRENKNAISDQIEALRSELKELKNNSL